MLWISATHQRQQLALQISSHSLSVNYLHHSKYIHWRSVPQSWRTAWIPYIFLQYSPLQWVRQFLAVSVHGSLKISPPNPFTHHFRIIFSSLPSLCSGSALALFSPSLWYTKQFSSIVISGSCFQAARQDICFWRCLLKFQRGRSHRV